jgi:hypothetical protein
MDAIMRRIATAVGQQSDELLEMSARDAVERIRSGDLSAEAYVTRLHRVLLPPLTRLDTVGPMARTVSDVALLDFLITGERAPIVDLRRVRIAIPTEDFWQLEPVDPGVAAVVREAFTKLRDAGCTLVEIDSDREVRRLVGTIDKPSQASVFGAQD